MHLDLVLAVLGQLQSKLQLTKLWLLLIILFPVRTLANPVVPTFRTGSSTTNSQSSSVVTENIVSHQFRTGYTLSVSGTNIESADVKTAFLQSAPKDRSLYVPIPRDAAKILQIEEFPYMKLLKPMYGQVDAPREWFMEASRRLIHCDF